MPIHQGFQYAGVQHSSECFCGNEYDKYGRAAAGDCNMACAGNSSQICGGGWRNSVYKFGKLYIINTSMKSKIHKKM